MPSECTKLGYGNENYVKVDKKHQDICKFSDLDDPHYILVAYALEEIVERAFSGSWKLDFTAKTPPVKQNMEPRGSRISQNHSCPVCRANLQMARARTRQRRLKMLRQNWDVAYYQWSWGAQDSFSLYMVRDEQTWNFKWYPSYTGRR